jgi:hypothetical protein
LRSLADSYAGPPGIELNDFMKVLDMLCNREWLVSARSLKWLRYAEMRIDFDHQPNHVPEVF